MGLPPGRTKHAWRFFPPNSAHCPYTPQFLVAVQNSPTLSLPQCDHITDTIGEPLPSLYRYGRVKVHPSSVRQEVTAQGSHEQRVWEDVHLSSAEENGETPCWMLVLVFLLNVLPLPLSIPPVRWKNTHCTTACLSWWKWMRGRWCGELLFYLLKTASLLHLSLPPATLLPFACRHCQSMPTRLYVRSVQIFWQGGT